MFASVGSDVRTALPLWLERAQDWAPNAYCAITTRLALKHAILRRSSFDRRLCEFVPMPERLGIIAHWCSDEDSKGLGSRMSDALGAGGARAVTEAFEKSVADGSVFQVSLRRLGRALQNCGVEVGTPHAPVDALLEQQYRVVQSFASAPPDRWDKLLEHQLSIIDSAAIHICWKASGDYRRQPGGGNSAVAVSQLGAYLAMRFGSAYERAESMYELAAAHQVIGHYDAACGAFELALELYLDDLAMQQPLECVKLLGDLNLVNLDKAAEAATWYRTGVDLARLWGLPDFVPPIAANLARAAYIINDFAGGRAAAEEAIIGAREHSEGRQIRIAALSTLMTINRALQDEKGAIAAARAMFDDLLAAGDWDTLSVFADDLAAEAMRSGEYELANKMMTEALAHLPPTGKPTTARFQLDVPSLMVSGNNDRLRHVRLWHLGGATAQSTRRFSEAQKRYATAVDLAQQAGDREGLRVTLTAWAGCLCELGSFEEAKAMYARATETGDTAAERVMTVIEGAGQLLRIAKLGILLSEGGGIVGPSEHLQMKAARAAVDLFDAAEPYVKQERFSGDQGRDLLWLESHARALDAWTARRAENPDDGVERAQAAVRVAEQIPDAVGALEALDVLYFGYRDSGLVQLAAQILCRVADVFTTAMSANVDAASIRRWVENEAGLPGIDLQLNRGEGIFFQPPADDLVRWCANAIRSPSLGMLALREHSAVLSAAQIEGIWKSESIWMPRNMGTLRNLAPNAMNWQAEVLARGGSVSVGPERWVDKLTSGYLLLAALSGIRPSWLDVPEWVKWCQRGYELIAGALWLLGLPRLALQHCPRPLSCEQPTSPASRLIPLTRDVANAPSLWSLAGQLALECGETEQAFAIAEGGIHSAVEREDWADAIRFRLIKAQCLRKRNESASVKAEHDACVSLLARVPDDAIRQELSTVVERLGWSLAPDDLRNRERKLMATESEDVRDGDASGADDRSDFDEELDRLLSAGWEYISLGNLDKASAALSAADELVTRAGVVPARARVLRVRGEVASNSGDLANAVRFAEEALAALEGTAEPDLHQLGAALGSLGAYRVIALERADLPRSDKATSPELSSAVEVLERSLQIHRALGERKDIMVNLINLGLADSLKFDVTNQLRRYLEALGLCADFDVNAGSTILFPISCMKIWTNIISICMLLGWRPEALKASEACLDLIGNQLTGLILEGNKLMSIPERDRLGQFALWTMWNVISETPSESVEAGRQGEEWDVLRGLRSDLAKLFDQYGICPAEQLRSEAESLYRISDEAKAGLRRHLWELMEDTKSRVLREHLRTGLRSPATLPTGLREREAAAFEAWQATTRRLRTRQDLPTLKAAIDKARGQEEMLRTIWDEMEAQGGHALEYARLRSGRSASFEMILSYVCKAGK